MLNSSVKKRLGYIINKYKSSAGFSLLELLTAMTIMAILTAAFFANYTDLSKRYALQRAAYKLTQDIRRAAEKTLAAEECKTAICGGTVAIVPQGGYGIYVDVGINPHGYILYADTVGNEKYESQSATPPVEQIQLEKKVTIKSVSSNNGKLSINFKPPSPNISFWAAGSGPNLHEVSITLQSGNIEKTIKVNEAGLIEVVP
jgi:prepilin-type N-terminal cleavage/methylation domain-containing protein